MAQQPTANGVHEPLLNGEVQPSSAEGANVSTQDLSVLALPSCWRLTVAQAVSMAVPHARTPTNGHQVARSHQRIALAFCAGPDRSGV